MGDQSAILSSLVARKATFLLALMWICSPVAGLRPIRAARFRTIRIPRPAIFTRSPFFQTFGDHPNEFFHHLQPLLLAELMLFRQFIGQVPRGNRCGRRLGSRCHVKHGVCS
jgi:hypothetical protein